MLLYTLQGIPCLYYGTEQSFAGRGDPSNREDMKFDDTTALYQLVYRLNALRQETPDLRCGKQTIVADEASAGLFLFKRGENALIVINTGATEKALEVPSGFRPQLDSRRGRETAPARSAEIWLRE